MKWIEVNKARNLDFNTPVFIKVDGETPEYGQGRLVKKEVTKDGVINTFEMATFENEVKLLTLTNVTHVAIP